MGNPTHSSSKQDTDTNSMIHNMLQEDCVVMKTIPGPPSKPSCSAVAPSWLKAEPASRGTTSWNCGNSSSRWIFYSSLQLTSPTCCRTWSSWEWRSCMASSVLETSTTSASKPFRCINIKHVLQCHASDTRKFNCKTNIFRQPCWKYAACSEYRWLLS